MKKTIIALLALGGIAMGGEIQPVTSLFDFTSDMVDAGTQTELTLTENYITVTLSGNKAWNVLEAGNEWASGFSTANIADMNDVFMGADIEATAADYVSIGGSSTLTVTISGLVADNVYTLGFITGGAENVAGAWNTVNCTNETLSVSFVGTEITAWGGQSVQRNQPTGIVAMVKADANGQIVLSTTSTSGHHATANGLVISGTPAIPEPTTATLSLLALAGLAARRRRK